MDFLQLPPSYSDEGNESVLNSYRLRSCMHPIAIAVRNLSRCQLTSQTEQARTLPAKGPA